MSARKMIMMLALLSVSGCAITPEPMTPDERQTRVSALLREAYQNQEPLTHSLTLSEAIARALKYNLDARVKLYEQSVAEHQVDLSRLDLLPDVMASAGYRHYGETQASSSKSVQTGEESLTTSTSQDNDSRYGDLSLTWNILDFGVGYVTTLQNSDRVLVQEERRRQVIQNVVQDVRRTYWRAAIAQRSEKTVDALLTKTQAALKKSKIAAQEKLSPAREVLEYNKALLETIQRLRDIQSELSTAKIELAALINLPSGEIPTLKFSDKDLFAIPNMTLPLGKLHMYALNHRPELGEELYNQKIQEREATKIWLSVLPGLELNLTGKYDSNSFLLNNQYATAGAKVVSDVLAPLTLPTRLRAAHANEDLINERQKALTVAILTQVNIAWLQYEQFKDRIVLSQNLNDVNQKLLKEIENHYEAGDETAQRVVQIELDTVFSNLERDFAYAELQNSYAKLLNAAGVDPIPNEAPDASITSLTQSIETHLASLSRTDYLKRSTEDSSSVIIAQASEKAPETKEKSAENKKSKEPKEDSPSVTVAQTEKTPEKDETPQEKTEEMVACCENSAETRWALQLGSFYSEENAQKAIELASSKLEGINVTTVLTHEKDGKPIYKPRMLFNKREEAKIAMTSLKADTDIDILLVESKRK